MTEASRKVIALGSPTGEYRATVEGAVRQAGAELSITRESAKALADIEQDSVFAVLVDMSALGAEHFCRKARASERLRRVPIIALSRNPGELSFNRIFTWGADDLVPLGAEAPLAARLRALAESSEVGDTAFGQAVVAESNAERCALLGRVLSQAGYDTKYATDAASAELYASQSETRVVVLNANLTPPRKLIETVEQAGALPVWVVIGEMRNLGKIAQSLIGIDRVVVTGSSGSPEDVLFVANELIFSRASKRSEWRALHGAPVQFREAGSDVTEFGFTYDVSPGGLYVRSLLPCDFSEVSLEIRPPRRDKLVRLRGRIVRRFRFGSSSIASAPPGFAVKLEGAADDPDLEAWVSACNDFALAPSAYTEASGPTLVIGAKDNAFKRPTPLGTARPVPTPAADAKPANRPLPADLRARTGPPPTEVASPAPPERPPMAEIVPTSDEIDEVLGMVEAPSKPAGRDSMHSDVGQMLADTLESERVSNSGALPVTMTFDTKAVIEKPHSDLPPPEDDKSDAETRKVPARPVTAVAAPAPAPAAATPAPAAATPPAPVNATLPRAPAAAPMKLPSTKATLVMGAVAPPPPPADTRKTAPATPPALARTQLVEPEPRPPQPQPAQHVANEETNAPTVPAPPLSEQAPYLQIPKSSRVPQVPAPVASPAALPAPAQAPLPAAAWAAIAPAASKPPPARPASSSRSLFILAAVLGFAGVVGAVIAGFLLGLIPTGGASAQKVSKPERVATPIQPTSAPSAVTAAPSAEPPPKATPSATAAAPEPAASTPPAPASAAPSAAPPPSAAPEASGVPPRAPPEVDLSVLAPTQGYLLVRSSANTKVFVMGKEVGQTNQPVVSSCGTRFVRIGPRLGEFIEPGGAVIIKCGALTEVKREPR